MYDSKGKYFAPLVLFVYNRLEVLKLTIESLQNNLYANETDLFIYSDGANETKPHDIDKVTAVREYIKNISGFKSVTIKEQIKNIGLANSVINGLTEVSQQYPRFIVLEDDLLTSKYYLKYMNEALENYESEPKVWCINGMALNPECLKIPDDYTCDSYFLYRNSSHGWATWSNRWQQAIWDHDVIKKELEEPVNGLKFNRGGNDLLPMMVDQFNHRVDSWSIRWTYTISRNDGICLTPINSHVSAQTDANGTHIKGYVKQIDNNLNLAKKEISYPKQQEVNLEIARRFALNFRNELPTLLKVNNDVMKLYLNQNYDQEINILDTAQRVEHAKKRYKLGIESKDGLRIVIVNTNSGGGGAAIAAYRMYKALRKQNIDVYMLVKQNNAKFQDKRIIEVSHLIETPANSNSIIDGMAFDTYFNDAFTGVDISKAIEILEADIVNFHWIAANFIDFSSIAKIKVPVIFSPHDQWYATGGCHVTCWTYSGAGYSECAGNVDNCKSCPRILSGETGAANINFVLKQNIYARLSRLAFSGVSSWVANEIRHSQIAPHAKYVTIHNVTDANVYKSVEERDAVCAELGLNVNKRYIFFGTAYSISDDKNRLKGFELLVRSLHVLHWRDALNEVELIALGNKPQTSPIGFTNVHYLGFINDESKLAKILGVCDVAVVPSFMENLPNMAAEAMSCGTPVVAFDVGGIPEIIDHQQNGYLAKPYDIEDLATGIQWVLDNYESLKLRDVARRKIINTFNEFRFTSQYLKLCRELFNDTSSSSTTRYVTIDKPMVDIKNKSVAKCLRTPSVESSPRFAEGGLRLSGKYKKSYLVKPLVSIITVVYNAKPTLIRTIESVLQQTYDNIEYIVIDGGSTDGSLEIIKDYSDYIDYYVSEKDSGIYDAMNKGLALATGETVAMLNADDWYELKYVEAIIEKFQYSKETVFFGNTFFLRDSKLVFQAKFHNMIDPGKIAEGRNINHQSLFIPSVVYNKLGHYNTKYGVVADCAYELLMVKSGIEMKFVDIDGVNYSDDGVSGHKDTVVATRIESIQAFIDFDFLGGHSHINNLVHMVINGDVSICNILDKLKKLNGTKESLLRQLNFCLSLYNSGIYKSNVENVYGNILLFWIRAISAAEHMPKISVIVPIYNSAKYLRRCLDSLVKQTLYDIEIILVNDCSTDDSIKIINEYTNKDYRIKLVYQEQNYGQHIARIDGYLASSGEYIGYVDSDDWVELDTFESVYNKAIIYDADIVRFSSQGVDESGNNVAKGSFEYQSEIFPDGISCMNKKLSPTMWTHIHHRRLWGKSLTYFPRERLKAEDNLTTFSLYAVAEKGVVSLSNKFYNYLQRDDSDFNDLSYNNLYNLTCGRIRILELLRQIVSNNHKCILSYNDRLNAIDVTTKMQITKSAISDTQKQDLLAILANGIKKYALPKVSIIVPVYNTAKYLRKCLDSLVNQTLKDIEIIIIDDCSTDDSLSIINDYANNDTRIKVIIQKVNGGQHVARIDGYLASSGEYIGYVDSDDWIELNTFEAVYASAKAEASDIVCYSGQIYDEISNKIKNDIYKFAGNKFNSGVEYLPHLYPSMCLHMHKRALWDSSLPYFPMSTLWGEDNLTCFILSSFANKVVQISDVFYCRLEHGESTTQKTNANTVKQHIEGRSTVLKLLRKFVAEKQLKVNLAQIESNNKGFCRSMISKLSDQMERNKIQLYYDECFK